MDRKTRRWHLEILFLRCTQVQWRCIWVCMCRAGVAFSTVEVRFENLQASASVFVGTRALPTVTNAFRNGFEVWSVDLLDLQLLSNLSKLKKNYARQNKFFYGKGKFFWASYFSLKHDSCIFHRNYQVRYTLCWNYMQAFRWSKKLTTLHNMRNFQTLTRVQHRLRKSGLHWIIRPAVQTIGVNAHCSVCE